MEFIDYDWDDIEASFVKEGILGSDFTFSTKSELTHTVDYLPKNQARKLYTFAKEQIDLLKNPISNVSKLAEEIAFEEIDEENLNQVQIEEMETEEVSDFAELIPISKPITNTESIAKNENSLANLSQDELFEKLQNYKKLLDNGLILQGEYDNYKKEILSFM